jgi:ketosteroid isomerase-like protein
MRNLISLRILAFMPLPLFPQGNPVQEVMSVRAGIGPAMRAKDAPALEKIWSPQMKVNSPGNIIMDRSTVLKLLSEGHIKYSAFKDIVESTSVFKDLVIIMGHEELTEAVGPDAGKPKIRRYTDVWQRNSEGSWMLIARQATYIAAP